MDDAFSDSDTKRQAARKMQTLPQAQNQSDSFKLCRGRPSQLSLLRANSGRVEAPPPLPGSWPGLSRLPRLFLLCALKSGVADTSLEATPVCESKRSRSALIHGAWRFRCQ
jgi:hypothetical protein